MPQGINTDQYHGPERRDGVIHSDLSIGAIGTIITLLILMGGALVTATLFISKGQQPSASANAAYELSQKNSLRINAIETELTRANISDRLARLETQQSTILHQQSLNQDRLDTMINLLMDAEKSRKDRRK